MGNQNKTIGVVDKGIPCNSRLFLIRPGKTSIDDQNFPITLDRTFSVFTFYRNVPVDNVGSLRVQSELFQNLVYHRFFFQKFVIRILFLQMRLFCLDKIPLKGRHLVFSEQRRIRMLPDAPHDILSLLFFLFIQREKAFSYIAFQRIIQTFPTVAFSTELYFL